MGEAERAELQRWIELFDRLPEEDRGELIHMAEHLARKAVRESGMTAEDRAWEDSAATDLGDRLAAIEADVPPAELTNWLAKISAGAVPVRYNPETGELEELRP